MSEQEPSTSSEDRLSSDVERFLRMQELMGYPRVLGPGVREPSIRLPRDLADIPSEGARLIRFESYPDGSYDIVFDEA